MSPLKQRMLEDMQLRLSGFSVDWVLLRDAARTLMKAAILIRKRGFQARMEEPEAFLNRMNRLCMKMSHARRKKDAKRARKAVLREMKKLSGIIAAHAERHRELLREHWRLGARQNLRSPKLARSGLGPAAAKALSSPHAGAEFGGQLLLGEAASGVIVDWELVNGHRTPDAKQADTKMLGRSLEWMNGTSQGPAIRQVCGDRGFDSASNREPALLENAGIDSAICPKSPAELDKKMKDPAFAKSQKRRSQTGARIAICKMHWLKPRGEHGVCRRTISG